MLQLTDTDFITLVEAGPGESATEFKPDTSNRHTNLVVTNDVYAFAVLPASAVGKANNTDG